MTAAARLRALRLTGFKSFAERTLVEFGPGISAVVGPNGSGKSNLADALRWVLGEQGRSLRARRSEDVIFAGSAGRRATGMADVTLVVANEDRLLPIDYAELELQRTLYRSGENEYLINRQRVRLRDLVDLLDSANLADNAFLFIGQGMVDQALSLGPEERRPLFEEVAGVRRHERRRRGAEAQLEEAEGNLARVRDILDELRPQARRLARQAEQQEARDRAAEELARALLDAARVRWSGVAKSLREAEARRASAERSLRGLEGRRRELESEAAGLAAALAARAAEEGRRREERERARQATMDLLLREERLKADLAAVQRSRERLRREEAAAEARATEARRLVALAVPGREEAPDALRELEARLEDARADLARLAVAEASSSERRAALEHDHRRRAAEHESSRRRAAEAERDVEEQRARHAAAARARGEAEDGLREAERGFDEARRAEVAAHEELERIGARLSSAEGLAEARASAVRDREAAAERLRARLEALEERARTHEEAAPRMARERGRSLLEGLDVEPALAHALEAALGPALRSVAVPAPLVLELARGGAEGTVVLDEPGATARDGERREQAVRAAREAGGGHLDEAVRRDPSTVVRRLVAPSLWVPDLAAALAVRPHLPAGWSIVARDGSTVTAEGVVSVGRRASVLSSRAAREAAAAELAAAEEALEGARRELAEASDQLAAARLDHERGRERAGRAAAARRAAEDRVRLAGGRAETLERDRTWAAAQLERLERDAERARAMVTLAEREPDEPDANDGEGTAARPPGSQGQAVELERLRRRVASLAAERDRLRSEVEAREAEARRAEQAVRRAEAALALDEARLGELERELAGLHEEESRLVVELEAMARRVAAAREDERTSAERLGALARADADARRRLASAEAATVAAGETLRAAEEAVRSAALAESEGRLQLESVRQGLLVELAALGPAGIRAVAPGAGGGSEADTLEASVERLVARWRSQPDAGAAAVAGSGPSVAALRRRYHELGASNPFATQEYAEIRARVEALDGQRADLEAAIDATRRLIGELETLIRERFRGTFAALEAAFARQFEELFGGGDAGLSLTDPDDLSSTGVEIVARPPGKKRQPLSMLSGGERALTAVALLFAMLEVRPVPFCVLDEVDAALDEANIARFVASLRRLAERIQFVVITHNRGTIEAADALHGVTIDDDAVSRVVSLRLAGAEETGPARSTVDEQGARQPAPATSAT